MTSNVYDVIVVGAGVEGSATAYNLALSKYRTLLIDQFTLPHTRGSSNGSSRITRKAYLQDYYCKMMIKAYEMWEELEKKEQAEIYVPTGLICVGPESYLDPISNALDSINSTYEKFDDKQTAVKFPMLRTKAGYNTLFDPDGGILRADQALKAFWNQFRRHGGTLHDGEPVIRITPGNPVVVTTTKQQYKANSVVLCAGPWTSKLTAPLGLELPLKPERIGVYYWKAKTPEFSADNGMPCGIYHNMLAGSDTHVYSLPALEYPDHMKICCHSGGAIDPDARDSPSAVAADANIKRDMCRFVEECFPNIEPYPSIQETCIYTITPDHDFVLDSHPKWKNIVIGAGFSGHGFKLAPVVGKLLAEIATGREPSFDVNPFKINRFNKEERQSKL